MFVARRCKSRPRDQLPGRRDMVTENGTEYLYRVGSGLLL